MGFDKYNRNFILTISPPGGVEPFTITRPFTIEFDINRNNYAGTNYAQIRIYNLSQYHRNLIRHDVSDTNAFNPLNIVLQAGYGDGPQYPIIFAGNAQTAYSHREGVNFITTITGFDGGTAYQNAKTDLNVAAGTSWQSVISSALADLKPYGINVGAVAPFEGSVSRGFGLSGNTVSILKQLTNDSFFIDSKVANVLPNGFAIGTAPFVTINSQTGLLNTPYVQQQILTVDILFEPRLIIGSTIKLESNASQAYNGIHQVIGITHRGVISEAKSGDATTSLTCRGGIFEGLVSQAGSGL
jgi:hypothetical protein